MIDPTPTRITDRPEMPVRRELVPSDAWNSAFCIACAVVVLIGSAWAIWESVR